MVFTSSVFAAPTNRLSGNDRYQTAVAIAKSGWTTSDVAVLATGENYADALCAASLAKKNDAPILLTPSAKLDGNVKKALTDLKVKKVIIVGGVKAVSQDIENEIKSMPNMQIQRIYGNSRFDTSVEIAKELGTFTEAALANAYGFADALSISSVAAIKGMPILLTEKDTVPTAVKNFISGKKVYAIGGTAVISDAAANSVNAERVQGSTRYATNAAVRSKFAVAYDVIYFATGEKFPDALAGAAIAAKQNGTLVLVNPAGEYTGVTVKGSTIAYAIGGTSEVPDSVLTKVVADIAAAKAAEDAAAAAAAKAAAIKTATDAIAALPATITLADKAYVEGARAKVSAAKTNNGAADADFTNLSTLTAAETKIADLEAAETVKAEAVTAANTAIAGLPTTIVLANKAAVTDARAKVDAAKAKGATDADFTNLSKLLTAETKIASLEAAVTEANAAIAGLPGTVVLADKAKVTSARAKVDVAIALGAVAADFTDLNKLVTAENEIKALEDLQVPKAVAISAANEALGEIPADLTLTDEAFVEATRDLVNSAKELGAVDTDFVGLNKLTAAEAKIAELKQAKDDAIKAVVDAIEALPVEITFNAKADVEVARALVVAAKAAGAVETEISNYATLTAAEETLANSVVADVKVENILPGIYIAKIMLKPGTDTTGLSAKIDGKDATLDSTGSFFYAQVGSAIVSAVVSKTNYTSKGTVAIPGGTLAGIVDHTSIDQVLPGIFVAKVYLKVGVYTADMAAKIDGVLMNHSVNASNVDIFSLQVTTNNKTAEIFGTTVTTENVVVK